MIPLVKNPDIHISTQILVGFPSETEDDFNETLEIIKRIHFDFVMVFPYHEKIIVPSSRLTEKIPDNVIRRCKKKAKSVLRKEGIKVYYRCP